MIRTEKRDILLNRVVAKLSADQIYKSQTVQDLIKKATELYPNYNLNDDEAVNVVKYVFKKISPDYRTEELAIKIHSGIT